MIDMSRNAVMHRDEEKIIARFKRLVGIEFDEHYSSILCSSVKYKH